MQNPNPPVLDSSRRHFFLRGAQAIGAAALATLLNESAARATSAMAESGSLESKPKARRVIYLFQSGAPSQIDLFDHKPMLDGLRGTELPDSIRRGQRLTGMTSSQASFPVAPSMFRFARHGTSGALVSELLPHTAKIADDLCFIKSMHTEAINHDPAVTFMQTGAQLAGRPSIGAWLSYGLGSENSDLPAFVAMISGTGDQPLYDRLWGSGFLPTRHAGVKFRSTGDPVLYLSDPPGISRAHRREFLDDLAELNRHRIAAEISPARSGSAGEASRLGRPNAVTPRRDTPTVADPETLTRIAQYEMAYRMQASVPELTDLSNEPLSTFDLYGEEARKPGTFAWNCLLARRLCERGVRFVQLFHRGWDQHLELPKNIRLQCSLTDRPTAALVTDLKQRGLLDDTLVVWSGEFGRTVYCQGKLTAADYGRDHHPRCFTMWLAGAGVRSGTTIGETDDFSYNIVRDPVHVHDLNATILHLLGIDHTQLTFRFQGRRYRLTDVHGKIVEGVQS